MVFWVAVNLLLSRVFLAIARASLCVFRCSLPESGFKVALVQGVGVVADWGPCSKLEKMVILQQLGWV